jgi:hypothetical protein
MASTTRKYLSYPAAAAGISRASSGGAAWSYSAYTTIVPVSTITAEFWIAGMTWMFHTPIAAADTTYEVLFELATDSQGTPVKVIEVPCSFRADTAVGYAPSSIIIFPEPKVIAANSEVGVRVAQSLATTSQTYTGIKLIYSLA